MITATADMTPWKQWGAQKQQPMQEQKMKHVLLSKNSGTGIPQKRLTTLVDGVRRRLAASKVSQRICLAVLAAFAFGFVWRFLFPERYS